MLASILTAIFFAGLTLMLLYIDYRLSKIEKILDSTVDDMRHMRYDIAKSFDENHNT